MNIRSKLIKGLLLFAIIAAIPGLGFSSERIDRIKQSVKSLDLSKTPSVDDLMTAGQLGGQLYPTKNVKYSKKIAQSRMEFGQAIDKWNRHEYKTSVKMFRRFIKRHPDNPWTDEARLHIGCDARYNGRYAEAEEQFQWIINNNKGKKYEGAKRLLNKARMRLGVLRYLQNDMTDSAAQFTRLKKESLSWRERTYASYWLRKLSMDKANRIEKAKCGVSALSYLLNKQGKIDQAGEILKNKPETKKGHSIEQLINIASKSGYDIEGVKLSIDDLDNVQLPAIVQIDQKADSGHYWVLEKVFENRVTLFDPQNRRYFEQSTDSFSKIWKGKAIVTAQNNECVIKENLLDQQSANTTYGSCCGVPAPEKNLGDPCIEAPKRKNEGNCPLPNGAPIWKVNMVNMNIFMTDIPLWYDSPIGPSVKIQLSYNSLSSIAHNEPFGNKWQFNYGSYLVVDTAGVVTIFMPDGRRDIYSPDSQGGYIKPVGIFNTLIKLAENHFELEFIDGTVYEYNIPAGTSSLQPFLVKITDRYNQSLTFSYDSNVHLTAVKDALNRETNLTYNAEGLVTQVADPFGRSASFDYDANQNLIRITDMGGIWTELSYDQDILLSRLKNSRGLWDFYVEPADGINGGTESIYPAPGSPMWETYRITVTDPMGGKEEYFYGGMGTQSHYISSNHYIHYIDESHNNIFNENKVIYEFVSTSGNISQIFYPTGETLNFSYDSSTNKLSSVSDPHGDDRQLEYNANGLVTKYTDGKGKETTISYYSNGIDIESINNGLGPITYTYNGSHDVTSVTDRENNVTRYSHNTFGQLLQIVEADGTPSQRTTEFIYNPSSHELVEIKTNGTTQAVITHDHIGRIDSYTDSQDVMFAYEYNDLNQVVRIDYPDEKSVVRTLSTCCPMLVDSITNRSGQTTEYLYDALKRLTKVQGPEGDFKYEYDANGNIVKFITSDLKETTFEYDALDRLVKKVEMDGNFIAYTYDIAGLLKTETNARGIVKTYSHDDNHNVVSISYSDSTPHVSFVYDEYNRLTSRTDGTGSYQFTYDNNSIMTSVDGPWENDKISYTYNSLGQRTALQIGNSPSTIYAYDSLNRLQTIQTNAGIYTYEYGNSGLLVQKMTAPNGSFAEYLYNDPLKRLTEIIHKKADQVVIRKNAFSYTDQDVIGTETITNGLPITSFQEGMLTYDFDNVNQLLSSSNPQKTFAYDDDGNMIRGYTPDGHVLTMAYDAENRLTSAEFTDSSQVVHRTIYTYTGDNYLAEMNKFENGSPVSTTRMFRDGLLSIQDRDENNQIVNEHTWGLNIGGGIGGLLSTKTGTENYFFLYDGKGNTTGLIDQNQNVVASYNYSPFGKLKMKTGTISQPYQFSTKRIDEQTGLVYYGHRYYSPSTGRWTARDPLGFAGGDSNLYGFALNNPANFKDPNGEFVITGSVVLGFLAAKAFAIGTAWVGLQIASQWAGNPELPSDNPCEDYHLSDYMNDVTGGLAVFNAGLGAGIAAAEIGAAALANPIVAQNAIDAFNGFFQPGPPPATLGGYCGSAGRSIYDNITE